MIYTVFFNANDEMPQDFETYSEAKKYADERNAGDYTIVSAEGEIQ